jgi:hypothetical protein
MPRDGAIIFGDLIGKLDVLRVTCDKCARAGRYPLQRLIDTHRICGTHTKTCDVVDLFINHTEQSRFVCSKCHGTDTFI